MFFFVCLTGVLLGYFSQCVCLRGRDQASHKMHYSLSLFQRPTSSEMFTNLLPVIVLAIWCYRPPDKSLDAPYTVEKMHADALMFGRFGLAILPYFGIKLSSPSPPFCQQNCLPKTDFRSQWGIIHPHCVSSAEGSELRWASSRTRFAPL